MKVKTWNIEAMTGYKPISTFYEDFSIADAFGESAIRGTYKRAMASWKTDYKMLTELVMALNWKIGNITKQTKRLLGYTMNCGKRQTSMQPKT